MLLLALRRKQYGFKKFVVKLGVILALRIWWISIVTTMEPLRRLRNPDLTNDPNIYFVAPILSERLLIGEM